jgi:hypothetical protein
MQKGTVFGLLVRVGFVSLLVILPSSCKHQQTKTEAAKKELAEFCKQANATPAFVGLPDGDLLTIDLQRSLFVKGKRVAFRGQLFDLYRSERWGGLVGYFHVSYSGSDIGVLLRCTDSQLQQLHDDYQKDSKAAFIVAAEFDEVEPDAFVDGAGVRHSFSARDNNYSVIGTLVSYRKSAIREPSSDDSDDSD